MKLWPKSIKKLQNSTLLLTIVPFVYMLSENTNLCSPFRAISNMHQASLLTNSG